MVKGAIESSSVASRRSEGSDEKRAELPAKNSAAGGFSDEGEGTRRFRYLERELMCMHLEFVFM